MTMSMSKVVLIAIALIVIAIILPIGLAYIGNAGDVNVTLPDGTTKLLKDVVDPAIITLLTILLPILVVIGIIMYFIPRVKG